VRYETGVLQDLRCACRALRHSQRFTLWVVGSLAIGMAVTIAAFAFLIALLIGPFPGVTEQNRLVRVSVIENCGGPDCWRRLSSPADLVNLREGLTGLQGLAGYTFGQMTVALPEARSVRGALTTANYFAVLGARPALGRMIDGTDEDSRTAVAVIAHRMWIRDFDADPSVIGRSIRVANEFVEIVGVAPEFFVGVDLRPARGDRGPDVWLPMWLADRVLPLTIAEQRRQQRDLNFVGRLRDGVEASQVQAEADVLARRLTASRIQGSRPGVAQVGRVWMNNPENWSLGVMLVMPVPILVLMLACVNAANLMLARGSQRRREIAIRLAIGAGRGRVMRQLLIESGILACLASIVAIPIASSGLQLASTPLNIPIAFNALVVTFAVATAIATTMTFGLMPAIRVSAQPPSTVIGASSARSDAIPWQSRMRRGLVIAQVALSLGLLATGWQLVATVQSQAVSSGTPADRLLIARFNLRPMEVAAGEAERFYRNLLDAASRLPGVEAAGVARHTSVWTFGQGSAPGSIVVWRPTDTPAEGRVTIGGYAGGELFQAVGVRVLAGRGFSNGDRQARPQVAMVNETFARSMGASALGSVLRVAPRGQGFVSSIEVRIVGVIDPVSEPRLTQDEPLASIYLPSPIEAEPALALYLRTRDRATMLAQPVRELVGQIDPFVPIVELGSLAEFNERSFGPQLWLARAAAFLGVIGLMLATAGLYGISSYVVAMRSREMAIRMAIGARPRRILAMVLGQSMRMAAIGLIVGGVTAAVVSRVIQAEYHGIQGIDGAAFGGATALFLAAMLLASAIPAVRASRLDPVEHLKDA
jgi:putative ABC transport system permease protein